MEEDEEEEAKVVGAPEEELGGETKGRAGTYGSVTIPSDTSSSPPS